MLIVCPACATEYTLDPDRVGSKGRIVRCARCKTSWFAGAAPLPAKSVAKAGGASASNGSGGSVTTVIDAATDIPVGRKRSGRIAAKKKPVGKAPFRVTTGLATATALATAIVALGAVAFRIPLVKAAPGAAVLFAAAGLPVNVLGLAIDDVASNFDQEDGRRVLVTEGTITNLTRRDQPVQDLELTVFGAENDTLYQWSAKPPAGEVAAGESKRFSVKLASPPPAGTHVAVTFAAPARGGAVASH